MATIVGAVVGGAVGYVWIKGSAWLTGHRVYGSLEETMIFMFCGVVGTSIGFGVGIARIANKICTSNKIVQKYPIRSCIKKY